MRIYLNVYIYTYMFSDAYVGDLLAAVGDRARSPNSRVALVLPSFLGGWLAGKLAGCLAGWPGG